MLSFTRMFTLVIISAVAIASLVYTPVIAGIAGILFLTAGITFLGYRFFFKKVEIGKQPRPEPRPKPISEPAPELVIRNDGFGLDSEARIPIYQETLNYINQDQHKGRATTQAMIRGTRRYNDSGQIKKIDGNAPVSFEHTTIEISNRDSFEAADLLIKAGTAPEKVLVLNLANSFFPGGGVVFGSSAQEECLFRSSDYTLALINDDHSAAQGEDGRRPYKNRIAEFGSYYTPGVTILRNTLEKYRWRGEEEHFRVACIAIAGYDLREKTKENIEKSLRKDQGSGNPRLEGEALLDALYNNTQNKIRHLFDVALAHGHTTLVLGALSCGAFVYERNRIGTVAAIVKAYKVVLNELAYKKKFEKIVFPVLVASENDRINFELFSKLATSPTPTRSPLIFSGGSVSEIDEGQEKKETPCNRKQGGL